MKIQSYKDLIVWQKSMRLVTAVFELTSRFPQSELYGITSQMRRAAVSVPSNIAEASGRRSAKEYRQFYAISYGSVLELETQLLISQKLNFGDIHKYKDIYSLLIEVSKMLHVMTFDLRNKGLTTKHYDLSPKI
ncbi:hypothetical protein A3C59_00745 [Candidatus Daviesbacteria bacterium RIFCSPHIGHO2_02_FULL_36_13]|uniref:Four helix bundle protein n=1 Tax=Candidatus Daviesbacteria bacterium RIFCSPHIGHO2_02_FULL_36_13 TaxID=1797768 RepID=A0A1F5JS92_9BACT|nr:MAG: hypothetical protein A3C59_00745 [Candidatus Daviesbacteria bacterium RIFCSPHIGHO2_02_FULL_36_13]